VLVDLKPSGAHYMEDFHRAGGSTARKQGAADFKALLAPAPPARPPGEADLKRRPIRNRGSSIIKIRDLKSEI
jgi:hypothetical protein